MIKKNLIIIERKLNSKMGGGCGYLYKLEKGLAQVDSSVRIISSDFETQRNIINMIKKKLNGNISLKILKIIKMKKMLKELNNWENEIPTKEIIKKIEKEKFVSIHSHHPYEFIRISNYLKKNNIDNVITILTSHDPGRTSDEIYNSYKEISLKLAKSLKDIYRKIEEEAFKRADYLIFPSEESVDYYQDLVKGKNRNRIKYVPTGTNEYHVFEDEIGKISKLERSDEDVFFSFVGRHNEVKGYDILKGVAEKVLKNEKDIKFILAGSEAPLKGINHLNWIEIGWTNKPGNVVDYSDVFIAPNRRAYFDLVILEAMSLGKPIIATATGGSKYMGKISKGILLIEPENEVELEEAILKIKALSKKERIELGKLNRKAYEDNFTLEKFASKYIEIIKEIESEFNNDWSKRG